MNSGYTLNLDMLTCHPWFKLRTSAVWKTIQFFKETQACTPRAIFHNQSRPKNWDDSRKSSRLAGVTLHWDIWEALSLEWLNFTKSAFDWTSWRNIHFKADWLENQIIRISSSRTVVLRQSNFIFDKLSINRKVDSGHERPCSRRMLFCDFPFLD